MYERQGAQPRDRQARSPRSSPSTTRSARPRRDRVRHRPGQPHQPVARGAAPRWSPSRSARCCRCSRSRSSPLSVRVVGDRRHGRRRAGRRRLVQARLGYSPSGRAVARNVAGGLLAMVRHLRRREPGRHARLTPRCGCSWRVVPPPEVVEHLDAFLEVRRAAGGVPLGAGRAAPRDRGVPRRRARPEARRPRRAAGPRPRHGVPPSTAAVAGGGAFPNAGRARVLWAGLDLDERGAHRAATGWRPVPGPRPTGPAMPVDGQRFRPHVTVARLGPPRR